MQRAVLEDILRGAEGVENQENEWVVSEGVGVDLLGSAGIEVMTLQGLRSLRFEESYLAATNEKNDTFFLEYDRVVGLRLRAGAGRRKSSRAGFAAG